MGSSRRYWPGVADLHRDRDHNTAIKVGDAVDNPDDLPVSNVNRAVAALILTVAQLSRAPSTLDRQGDRWRPISRRAASGESNSLDGPGEPRGKLTRPVMETTGSQSRVTKCVVL